MTPESRPGPTSPGSLRTREIAGRRSRREDGGLKAATHGVTSGHWGRLGRSSEGGGGGCCLGPEEEEEDSCCCWVEGGWLREEEPGPVGAGPPP
jgi:hypothetical protein